MHIFAEPVTSRGPSLFEMSSINSEILKFRTLKYPDTSGYFFVNLRSRS